MEKSTLVRALEALVVLVKLRHLAAHLAHAELGNQQRLELGSDGEQV